MSTLKQELQIIVDEDLLNKYSWYICNNLSKENRYEFEQYKEIASNYGKEDWKGGYAWWEEHTDFVISEKYRFIKDLIKTL